jgi:hypothetical protein
MSPAITIYSQEYNHKGHAFSVWSYLDDPDPERSTMGFAYRAAGVTRAGLPDRQDALRQARRHLDALAAPPDEQTAVAEAPMAGQAQQQHQQQAISRQPDPAKQTQGELFP